MELIEMAEDVAAFVYVVDPVTYKIEYLSPRGAEFFGVSGKYEGQTCYRLLGGNQCPCPQCRKEEVGEDKFLTWHFSALLSGRDLLMKEKLIDWKGKKRLLVCAFDVPTRQPMMDEKLESYRQRFEAERDLMFCLRDLSSSVDGTRMLNCSMSRLGTFLRADRVFIFEYKGEQMSNTYEWCASGVSSRKEISQGLPRALLARWEKYFAKGDGVDVADVAELKETAPQEYEYLTTRGARGLFAVPLPTSNGCIGFIGADNPARELYDKVKFLFSVLAYMFANTLICNHTYERLHHMSYYDVLTGLHNRNSYMGDLKKLEKTPPASLGVVFMDVNGLKVINDNEGHESGDRRLCYVAEKLTETLGDYRLYRLGGDEFLALCSNISKEEFGARLAVLHEKIGRGEEPAAAVGASWSEGAYDLREAIADADKDMYRVKHGRDGKETVELLLGGDGKKIKGRK